MVEMNHEDFVALNSQNNLTTNALRTLLRNIAIVSYRRNIPIIGGLSPQQYETLMLTRIGNEPMVRLLFVMIRDINAVNILLAEVLVEDPVLFIQAMEQGDIYIYYNQYPLQN
jgi:hypothetical protein